MSNTHLFLTEVNQVREMICSFVIQWAYTAFTGNFDVYYRTKYLIWIALMCIVVGLWSIHLFEVTPLNIFSFSVISSFHWKLQLLCWNIWAGQRPEECGNSSVLKPMFSVCVCTRGTAPVISQWCNLHTLSTHQSDLPKGSAVVLPDPLLYALGKVPWKPLDCLFATNSLLLHCYTISVRVFLC